MKPKQRKSAKAKFARTPRMNKVNKVNKAAKMKMKTKAREPRAVHMPAPISEPISIKGKSDSDRGLYVRFESPEIKATVKAAADRSNVSMNAYIVAATLAWVEEGKTLDKGEMATQGEVPKAS